MAAGWQAQVTLDEAWFVAFPASRAVGERWITEMERWYEERSSGESLARIRADFAEAREKAVPMVAQREWIRQVLAEVALPDGEERVREVLGWVKEAAVTYGESAWWLTNTAAERVLFSEHLEQVYPLTGPKLRERLPECARFEQELVAIWEEAEARGEPVEERWVDYSAWARDQLARYRAIISQEGQA